MNHSTTIAIVVVLSLLPARAIAQGDFSFSYQGVLMFGDQRADATYDLQFDLYDGPDPATAFNHGTDTHTSVTIENGLYSLILDFGYVFTPPDPRWLQISVRETGGSSFEPLEPLTFLATVPYAAYAWNAGSAASAVIADEALMDPLACITIGGPRQADYSEATCTNDYIRTGGGCSASGGSLTESSAKTNSWFCEVTSGGEVSAEAVCCRAQ